MTTSDRAVLPEEAVLEGHADESHEQAWRAKPSWTNMRRRGRPSWKNIPESTMSGAGR